MPLRPSRWSPAALAALLLAASTAAPAQDPADTSTHPRRKHGTPALPASPGDDLNLETSDAPDSAPPSDSEAPPPPTRRRRKKKKDRDKGAPPVEVPPLELGAVDGGEPAPGVPEADAGVGGETPRDVSALPTSEQGPPPDAGSPPAPPGEPDAGAAPDGLRPAPAWSAITGVGLPEGDHLIWAELGAPGITATYRVGEGRWFDVGGAVEVDFPPLNGVDQGLPGAALHLIGDAELKVARFEPGSFFVRADPQWILDFSGISLLYFPITLGLGFDFDAVHAAVEVGVAPYSAGLSAAVPFDVGGVAPPTLGVALEVPVNDRLAVTLRLRLQTFLWSSNLFADDSAASLFFFGGLSVGAVFRL